MAISRSSLVVCVVLANVCAAQQNAPDSRASCDPSAIRWALPGEFAVARERAVAEGRLLVVKGISFGVDAIGARCATKGRW